MGTSNKTLKVSFKNKNKQTNKKLLTMLCFDVVLLHCVCFMPGGGLLVFTGGYDARTRKQVKRVVFPTVDVRA